MYKITKNDKKIKTFMLTFESADHRFQQINNAFEKLEQTYDGFHRQAQVGNINNASIELVIRNY